MFWPPEATAFDLVLVDAFVLFTSMSIGPRRGTAFARDGVDSVEPTACGTDRARSCTPILWHGTPSICEYQLHCWSDCLLISVRFGISLGETR